MKTYEPMEMEVIEFTSEDVITTSIETKITRKWDDEEEEE